LVEKRLTWPLKVYGTVLKDNYKKLYSQASN
jgi:hypothetical protein